MVGQCLSNIGDDHLSKNNKKCDIWDHVMERNIWLYNIYAWKYATKYFTLIKNGTQVMIQQNQKQSSRDQPSSMREDVILFYFSIY